MLSPILNLGVHEGAVGSILARQDLGIKGIFEKLDEFVGALDEKVRGDGSKALPAASRSRRLPRIDGRHETAIEIGEGTDGMGAEGEGDLVPADVDVGVMIGFLRREGNAVTNPIAAAKSRKPKVRRTVSPSMVHAGCDAASASRSGAVRAVAIPQVSRTARRSARILDGFASCRPSYQPPATSHQPPARGNVYLRVRLAVTVSASAAASIVPIATRATGKSLDSSGAAGLDTAMVAAGMVVVNRSGAVDLPLHPRPRSRRQFHRGRS